jgi:hypothetical protein
LLAVENLSANPALGLAIERDLEPLGHEAFPNVFHGFRATVEGIGDLGVGPVRSVGIRLDQNLGTTHLL